MNNKQKISFDEFIRRLYVGRIGRKNWIFGVLVYVVAVGFLIPQLLVRILPENVFPVVFGAIFLFSLIFVVSLHVRRLHDTNKSGWWSLLIFIPPINLILLFLLLCKGDDTPNAYGDLSSGDTKFIHILFNKNELRTLEIKFSGHAIAFLGTLSTVYIALWIFRSVWFPSLIGLITALFFEQQTIRERGASRTIIITISYVIIFFFFILLLTAVEKEYGSGCSNAPLSCQSLRFFRDLMRY